MIKEGGRLARRNGEAGRDGGETPPLQMHAEAPPGTPSNPYPPGAGTPPPGVAGRDDVGVNDRTCCKSGLAAPDTAIRDLAGRVWHRFRHNLQISVPIGKKPLTGRQDSLV
jgi:hypothetical protein